MKKRNAIGCLFAFTALVASGISFSGAKVVTADDIPVEEHYVVPAGVVTPAYEYTDGPSSEPKYNSSTGYRNTSTGSDGLYYYFCEDDTTYGRMNVASTWSSYRGEGVKVAVIDTGCYTSHEDFSETNFSSLSKNIYSGGTSASDYTDTNGHGTSSVSTIAASINSVGGLGIAPNVELIVLKIDHPTNGMQVSYMNSALQWCIDNGVDVINMSVQGYASQFSYSYTEDFGQVSVSGTSQGTMSSTDVSAKLNACYNAGITVVAAAGNYNSSNKSYPAANDHVIAVASTGLTEANKNKKAGYSNYGDWVDICAPGYIMTPTTSATNSYSITYGTSFSSPLVAGAVALYKCKYPDATPDQIERALKFTADKLDWSGSGAGAINVGAFLNQAPDYVYVESLSLSEETKTLTVGDTYTLNPTISPSNAANKNVIYESSDPDICSVDSNGVLTAHSVGQDVYIYATSEENSDVYDGIVVNVEPASDTPQDADVALSGGTYSGSDASAYITWNVSNVLTIKQEKGTGNNVANYVGAPRWYQNNIIRFTPENDVTITSITFTLDSSYKDGLTGNIWSNGLYSLSSNTGTWTGETSDEFTVTLKSQTRPTAISVRYTKGSGGGSGGGETNYTVTFNANGGTGTMANQTTTGSTYITPSCAFTYSGYTFNKWALNSVSGTQYSTGETINSISANITLYAIWVEQSSEITYIDDDYGNYYSSITTQEGDTLRNALKTLNDTKRVRTMSYDGLKTWGQYTEIDWTGSANVQGKMFGFYDNALISNVWDNQATWNREHVWPNSLGGGTVDSDMHMVRPASVKINSSRGNKYYGTGSSNYDPGQYDAYYRGVAARIIFYCAIANTNLKLADVNSTSTSNQMGKLSDLLQWNLQYAPDRASNAPLALRIEQNRNKVMYSNTSLQRNRNPFIDHPEYACKIWGNTNDTTRSICGLSGKTLSSLTYTGSPTKTTYEEGDSFDPTGLTITATYSDNSTANVTSSVVWTPSPLTEGTTSVTGSYTYGNNTLSVTVNGLTVTEKTSGGGETEGGNYVKVTSNLSDWSGEYLLVYENANGSKAWGGLDSNNDADVTISSNTIVKPSGAASLTVESMTGGYSIRVNSNTANDGKYISGTSGSNATNFNANKAANTISYSNNSALITSNTSVMRYNTSAHVFRYYKSSSYSSQAAVQLYKLEESAVPKVNSIDIISSLSLDAYNNKTYTFNPVIDADEGADTTVSWNSSDPTVASINSSGTVTALKAGSTTITATCGGKTDTCTVTVSDSTPIAVTGVSLNKSSTSISLGSTETLVATVLPANATNKNVTWTSSTPSKATVSNSGVITPVAVGSTTITVTTIDGGFTATCTVTITAAPVITYQLEADVSEVPFNSGTNHVASVGVKVYQYNDGVKGSVVETGSVNVDTSSLGKKTIEYIYEARTYSCVIKVTNHSADIGETIPPHEEISTEDASISHTFTSNSVDGLPTGWSGTKSGTTSYEAARGFQLQKSATCSIVTASYTNIKSIQVNLARSSNGEGSFKIKIGSTEVCSYTSFTTTSTGYTYSTTSSPKSGVVTITGSANKSSLYIKSITINYEISTTDIIPGEYHDATKLEQARAWATYFVDQTRTADTCLAEQDSQKLAGLQAKWADLAYEYNEMIGDSKDEFCTSSDTTIVTARNHYLFIISKFGANNLGEDGAFVKNSSNTVLSSTKGNSLITVFGENNNTTLVAIFAIISVSSIGLCIYLRKRKQD